MKGSSLCGRSLAAKLRRLPETDVKRNLARSQNLWEETFLRLVVDRLRAAEVTAIWLCDRGFHRVKWLEKLLELKQQFVVRLQRDVTIHFPARSYLLTSLIIKQGEREAVEPNSTLCPRALAAATPKSLHMADGSSKLISGRNCDWVTIR
jgi:hypothetical protein